MDRWCSLLLACTLGCTAGAPPHAETPSETVSETGDPGVDPSDSGGGIDSGGGTGGGRVDVEPGPDCRDDAWPLQTAWNVLAAHVVAGQADEDMVEDVRVLVSLLRSGTQPGPWDDQVKGPLISSDGGDFGDQRPSGVVDHASVPAATLGPDGDLWLFFVDADLDAMLEAAESGRPMRSGIVGVGGLGAARSADGVSFTRVELRFEGEVPLYIVDPDITPLPDGRYRMTYFGVPAAQVCADHLDPAASALPHRAYTAVSEDLQTWTHEGVAWTPEGRGSDPAVWCEDGGRCWLWMGGGGVSVDGGRTYAPVSMELPGQQVTAPDVFAVPGGWRMLYVDGTQLSTAVSADGLSWTEDGTLPLSGADPTVVERDGDWWLYIKGKAPTDGG